MKKPFIRNNTQRVPRADDLEVRCSLLTVLPGTEDERQYLEIREYCISGESYGHGVNIPLGLIDQVTRSALAASSVR